MAKFISPPFPEGAIMDKIKPIHFPEPLFCPRINFNEIFDPQKIEDHIHSLIKEVNRDYEEKRAELDNQFKDTLNMLTRIKEAFRNKTDDVQKGAMSNYKFNEYLKELKAGRFPVITDVGFTSGQVAAIAQNLFSSEINRTGVETYGRRYYKNTVLPRLIPAT